MEAVWRRTQFTSQRNGQPLETFFGETPLARTLAEKWSPTVDISETKDSFIIKAELPGMDEKDLNLGILENVLTIKGEKKKGEGEKDEHFYSCERCYGAFQCSFQLQTNVQGGKVDAVFEKGVLKITLPGLKFFSLSFLQRFEEEKL